MEVKRPLLRYHGGKWAIASWILTFIPKHKFYVELFGGGGSILLRKSRSYAEIYEEHINLAKILNETEGAVMVSGYHSLLYDDLYKGWIKKEKKTKTNMHGDRTEVLWMKGIEPDLFHGMD